MVTSVRVEPVGAHDHVHVWVKHGKAGVLIVPQGDGKVLQAMLLAEPPEPLPEPREWRERGGA